MKKAIFSIVSIAAIIKALQVYDKLYVTTEGQMFQKEIDANEAVRTQNAIIDEPEELIGVVELTKSMFTDDVKRGIGNGSFDFNALFDEARIPKQRGEGKKDTFERKHEAPQQVSKTEAESIDALLGLTEKAEPAKAEPAKAEPAKVEPVKDEPAKDEPAKDEPAKDEPAKDEPAKDKPTAGEKAAAIKEKLGLK